MFHSPYFAQHFWDVGDGAACVVGNLGAVGSGWGKEDIAQHAWEQIGNVYFSRRTANPGAPTHLTIRHPYRNWPIKTHLHKPDAVVMRIGALPNRVPGQPPRTQFRDIIWIENKAPKHEQPGHWIDVLNEAVIRLQGGHANRAVYLVLSIGIKWMIFKWNPTQLSNPPLAMTFQNGTQVAALDARISLPTFHGVAPRYAWVAQQTGATYIESTDAYSLDFWTPDTPSLQFLECCFHSILQETFSGMNPPEWG